MATPDANDAPPLRPWDLALHTREDTLPHITTDPTASQRHANDAWHRLLTQTPLLYVPDRQPHGDCDARVDRGPRRRLWRRDELLAFDALVEQRTLALLQHQQAVLRHWRHAATRIQAHTRGLLARRRVARLRQQLYEAAQAALRARQRAAECARQLHAAIRIQTVYHRHSAHVHYVFACRRRVHQAIRLYMFRWQRQRAARVLERAWRAFRRRVALGTALGTLRRLLRLSRQRAQLETATRAFHAARRATRETEKKLRWQRHPPEMAHATRVHAHKARLQNYATANASLPQLALPLPNPSRPRNQSPSSSHATRLPRLHTQATTQ